MTQAITYGGAPKQTQTLMDIVTRLLDLIELNEGEITDEIERLLDVSLAEKVESYRYVMIDLQAQADMLDGLAEHYGQRANSIREQAERVKDRLQHGLEQAGVDKLKTRTCTVYFQSTKSVHVGDEKRFLETAEDRFVMVRQAINRSAIKEALDAGEKIEDAELRTSKHLRFR